MYLLTNRGPESQNLVPPNPVSGLRLNVKTVLSVSNNAFVLGLRNQIIEQAGYGVDTAVGTLKAQQLIAQSHYDLLVIGHSIPTADRRLLVSSFKNVSHAPAVEVNASSTIPTGLADREVDALDPEHLLGVINDLIGPGVAEHPE